MILHGRDDDLGWKLEEPVLEAAGDRHRPLDQRGDLVEQRAAHQRDAVERSGEFEHAAADPLAPLGKRSHHVAGRLEPAFIGRRRDPDRPAAMKAMPARDAAGGNAQQRAVHDVAAEQHDDPVHRPDELRGTAPPAHPLRDRQLVERFLDDARQQGNGLLAGAPAFVEQEGALGFLDPAEAADRGAAGFRKRGCGTRGLAVGIEGGRDRGALAPDLLLGLAHGEARNPDGEPPRRGVGDHLAMLEPGGAEAAHDAVGKGAGKLRQRLGRKFLGADLDQEVALLHFAAPAAPGAASGAWCPPSIGKPSASRLLK